MFGLFKKREEIFHNLIERQAERTYEGLQILEKYLANPNPELAEQLTLKEKEADEVRRILIDELNRTFVTPFDREDIFALSRSIDDVLDYAYTTVNEMAVLDVTPTPYMQRIASLLKDAAYEIYLAMQASIRAWPSTMPNAPRRWRTALRRCIARRLPICSIARMMSNIL